MQLHFTEEESNNGYSRRRAELGRSYFCLWIKGELVVAVMIHLYFVLLHIPFTISSYHFTSPLSIWTFSHHF